MFRRNSEIRTQRCPEKGEVTASDLGVPNHLICGCGAEFGMRPLLLLVPLGRCLNPNNMESYLDFGCITEMPAAISRLASAASEEV